MIIYKITNTINNKIYIGQTIRPLRVRWNSHKYEARNSKTRRPICLAIRKYGSKKFKIEVLENASSIDELNILEQHYIKVLKCNNPKYGYNASSGGLNSVPTKETRKRMSLAKKGKPTGRQNFKMTREHVEKLRQINLGRIPWNKGKKQSEEQKLKHSLRMKGRTAWNKGNYDRVDVIVTNVKDNSTKLFTSKQEAADYLNVSKVRVNQALGGIYPIIKKFFKLEIKDYKGVVSV